MAKNTNPFRYFDSSPEVIRTVVMMYVKFPLSLRNVEDNRVENSHQPFRRRERAMLRFRQMKTLQKFSSVHAAFHNHFNQDRHLISRETYKAQRSAALVKWKMLAA
ncbi:hypothetical protein BH10PSE2_BH10PSE2_20210 [soil metagenome]